MSPPSATTSLPDAAPERTVTGEATSRESRAAEDLPDEFRPLPDTQSADAERSLDEIFGLLRNQRRREVLRYLLRTETGTATQGELAEYIAAKENDIQIRQLSSGQRKNIYVQLHQCHLPKLDEGGVIDFERDGTVKLQESATPLVPYLVDSERVSNERDPTLELGIAGAVATVVTAGALGLGPLAAIPPLAWVGVSIAGIVAITVFHYPRRHSESQ